MSATSGYVQRFVHVARALAILPDYPEGIRLCELAAKLDVTEAQLREEIRAYHEAGVTVDPLGGGYCEPVIEFVTGADAGADEVLAADAPLVRLRDYRPAASVGTRFLSFGKMAEVVAAGQRVLDHEPENAVLAAALDVVTGSVLAGATPQEATWPEVVARRIRQAGSERRRVRITYAMLWKAGIVERVIEPYRVFRTQRGWEIDAAVVDRDGAVATFTASGILAVEALPERFRRPPDTDHRIERRRRTLAVELAVPFAARWVVELHAESIEVIDEDEDSVTIRAHLLPPVGPRLGLVLLAAGPQAFVVAPATWRGAGQDLARALLAHYSAG